MLILNWWAPSMHLGFSVWFTGCWSHYIRVCTDVAKASLRIFSLFNTLRNVYKYVLFPIFRAVGLSIGLWSRAPYILLNRLPKEFHFFKISWPFQDYSTVLYDLFLLDWSVPCCTFVERSSLQFSTVVVSSLFQHSLSFSWFEELLSVAGPDSHINCTAYHIDGEIHQPFVDSLFHAQCKDFIPPKTPWFQTDVSWQGLQIILSTTSTISSPKFKFRPLFSHTVIYFKVHLATVTLCNVQLLALAIMITLEIISFPNNRPDWT